MSTSPDNIDVIVSRIDPKSRDEYAIALEEYQKTQNEYWKFEIVPDIFKQSLETTDETLFNYFTEHFGKLKPWHEILEILDNLNANSLDDEVYKLFFLARHGQGYHNQAHSKYGDKKWNEHWSHLDTDGEITWGPDPELTHLGVLQANDNYEQWKIELADEPKLLPVKWYSSPFKRSLDTLIGTWNKIVDLNKVQPLIIENVRETIGVHTCDMRSPKSVISERYAKQGFRFEEGFAEEDIYWKKDVRELIAQQAMRCNKAFQFILNETDKQDQIINITSHSGSIRAQLLVLGHRPFAVGTGGMIPVMVKGKKVKN